jgi:hypothetical protein
MSLFQCKEEHRAHDIGEHEGRAVLVYTLRNKKGGLFVVELVSAGNAVTIVSAMQG